MKKILIITPKFPIPTTGACEQERLAGILQLKRLGYEVRVISKIFDWQDKEAIKKWCAENDLKTELLPYSFFTKNFSLKLKKLANPKYWDGAAAEYFLPDTQKKVQKTVEQWKPDLVWFDYTYLWPLYKLCQKGNIPIITRSINFEPAHFLQEDGFNLVNLIKFVPKLISEIITARKSDFIFAITPKEEKIYRRLGVKHISTLPLRSLPALLKSEREILDKDILHLFFMGAGYSVPHIRKGAEFVIKEVAPAIEKQAPGKFIFHILGKKLPEDLKKSRPGGINNIKAEGFVDDLQKFLAGMDIAVIPSLLGAGMQQKIFEPLCLGIPTITSPRGLAGYPFRDGEHLLLAKTADEYVKQIMKLQDVNFRQKLSENALKLCNQIFAQQKLNNIIQRVLNHVS